MYFVPKKNGLKNPKKIKTFAEGLTVGPRQRLTGSAVVTQRTKIAEG